MYPIQNCQCYPNTAQGINPYLQPQVNAVKIDINNPQAYGGTNSQGQTNPIAPAIYNYPYNSVYNVPQVQQYNTPGVYPMPQITPALPQVPMATTIPTPVQPVQTTQVVQQPIQQNIQQQIQSTQPVVNTNPVQPVIQQAPVVQQVPVVPVPMPIPAVPVVPPASVITPQPPVVNAPVTQTVNVNPSVPTTVTNTSPNAVVEPVKPVEAHSTQNAGIDVDGILKALSSTNIDDQTAAIQKVAEVAQTNPVAAKALLNEQVFGQLVNVINADTSKLQGPANGKPDPQNLSPLEKAEINKQFAVYTLAILQKNFREEINKEMKKNNLPDIAINDIPYIKEGIVNNLKDNPNPTIREACLSALNYIKKPEDKEVLKVLYDISAKHDSSPAVKEAAKDYLTKLTA